MDTLIIPMTFERSTKNKHRFIAGTPDAAVSEVYINKRIMPAPLPQIEVTVKVKVANASS